MMVAVSLNVGGGVCLIKPAKQYMCTQNTTTTTRTDVRRRVWYVRQWFRTAEPLGERRYENWNIHTRTHTHNIWLQMAQWLLGLSLKFSYYENLCLKSKNDLDLLYSYIIYL